MLVLQLDPHLTTDKMNQYLLIGDLAGRVKVQNIQVDCKKSVNSFFLFSNLTGKVNSNLFFFLVVLFIYFFLMLQAAGQSHCVKSAGALY